VRTTIICCDRCRREITGPMSTLAVSGTLADTIERIDLCQSCSRSLLDFIRAAHTPRGEAVAPEADGSHGPTRQRTSEAPRPPPG
jgi:hypothetical protein